MIFLPISIGEWGNWLEELEIDLVPEFLILRTPEIWLHFAAVLNVISVNQVNQLIFGKTDQPSKIQVIRGSQSGVSVAVTGLAYACQQASKSAASGVPSVTMKRNLATYGVPGSMENGPSCWGAKEK